MDEQQSQPFDHWCIVELMGHQRIAGRVTEVNLFGSALMRVDVPEVDDAPGFSKFFGANAIYAITPVEERIARAMAKSFDQRPVVEWELRRLMLPDPEAEYAEDHPDSDGEDDETGGLYGDYSGDDEEDYSDIHIPPELEDEDEDFDGDEPVETDKADATL